MLNFRMDMPLYLMTFYGSIMIFAVCILRCFLKNRLPKFVFPMLWGVILLRLLVPFSISSPISASVPQWNFPGNGIVTFLAEEEVIAVAEVVYPGTAAIEETTSHSFTPAAGLSPENKMMILSILFCLGGMVTLSILLYQKKRYGKILNASLLIEHNETINTIIREMGMGHVLVFTNDEIASPIVCGLLRPRIYLPTRMDFQNTALLRHILAHETMHIKRGDNWVKAVMVAAICLNWYNPLVWLMSKFLSSDLERACDAAVLGQIGTDQRQSYAGSLLSMAITGNKTTLLYSAFSKTEVERRIKSILQYKKATAFTLAFSLLFLLSSTAVFATVGQAPFSDYLSSYCASSDCRWSVKAALSRDIVLGENPQKRADNVIFDILDADRSNDPAIIKDKVQTALSKEFGVEKKAFRLTVSLSLNDDALAQEYEPWGITKGKDGLYLFNGEKVRDYTDEMLHSVQTRNEGTVDITVVRDRLGNITSVTALHKGDSKFDHRTREINQNRYYEVPSGAVSGTDNEAYTVEQSTKVEQVQ